jgi:hypothetical protein
VAGPVEDASPSAAFLKVFDPVLRRLLRSRLAPWLGGCALLTFCGRRTGRTYQAVVTFHELDGQVYVVTPRPWRANFAGGGAPMRMRHAGVEVPGTGVLDDDPAFVADVINRLRAAGEPARAFALRIPEGHRLTTADVTATNRAVVRFLPAP